MRYAYLDTPEVGWVLQFLFPKRWEDESAATGTPLSLRRARNFPAKPKSDVPVGALWCAIVEGFDAPLSVHSGETRPLSPHTPQSQMISPLRKILPVDRMCDRGLQEIHSIANTQLFALMRNRL